MGTAITGAAAVVGSILAGAAAIVGVGGTVWSIVRSEQQYAEQMKIQREMTQRNEQMYAEQKRLAEESADNAEQYYTSQEQIRKNKLFSGGSRR